ncbi:MAG: flagellar type III secretion system protein FliR [Calditrichaeota bacterium]|nr:flagellar type III secretion system protein FliR [Calditrichota bacterium]
MSLAWQAKIEFYALILVRVLATLAVLPFYGDRRLPFQLRVGFALIVAGLLFPVVSHQHGLLPRTLPVLFLMVVKEAAVGLLMGFVALLMFMAFQFGGQIVGFQMGFAIVNVIDPQSQQQISLIGSLEYTIAALLFLVLNGHHLLLMALARSFALVPPLSVSPDVEMYGGLVRMTSEVFVIGVRIAAPAMAALLLTNVALSIIARTVPQMNIFIVGFPIGIAVGLAALAFSTPMLVRIFGQLLSRLQLDLAALLAWL